jgi:hypothetical protein
LQIYNDFPSGLITGERAPKPADKRFTILPVITSISQTIPLAHRSEEQVAYSLLPAPTAIPVTSLGSRIRFKIFLDVRSITDIRFAVCSATNRKRPSSEGVNAEGERYLGQELVPISRLSASVSKMISGGTKVLSLFFALIVVVATIIATTNNNQHFETIAIFV